MTPCILIGMLASCVFCADDASAQWIEGLPQRSQDSILWSADHEEGDLDDWEFYDFEFAGGGIFNSGGDDVGAEASIGIAHSGLYSARTKISNAIKAQNGKQAVSLMRWTNRPWDDGGFHFPKECYYSTWMYFPETYNPNKYQPWDAGEGGWWNVFQFKANDEKWASQPVWSLEIEHNDQTNNMNFYLFSKRNSPSSYAQINPIPVPVGRWVHVEAYYRVSAANSGQITVWQDGVKILDANDVRTAISVLDENAIWGIGNDTDHIDGGKRTGTATIYFDDAIISTRRISSSQIDRPKIRR